MKKVIKCIFKLLVIIILFIVAVAGLTLLVDILFEICNICYDFVEKYGLPELSTKIITNIMITSVICGCVVVIIFIAALIMGISNHLINHDSEKRL